MGKSRYIYDVKKNTKETTDVRCGWKDYKVHEYLPWHVCLFTALQVSISSSSLPFNIKLVKYQISRVQVQRVEEICLFLLAKGYD